MKRSSGKARRVSILAETGLALKQPISNKLLNRNGRLKSRIGLWVELSNLIHLHLASAATGYANLL